MKRAGRGMETIAAVVLLAGALHADGAADEDGGGPPMEADTADVADVADTGNAGDTPEAWPSPPPAGRKPGSGARLFETWEAALEGGLLTPVGDLADFLEPAPLLGLRATTSYYRAWRAAASLSGALLDGPGSPVPVAWIAGAAGLEWRSPRPWIPAPGAALSLYYVRATESAGPDEGYFFLEDGESEFGFQAGLRWHLPLSRQLGLEAGIRWDVMFTRPSSSHAASAAVGAAWIR